MFIVLDYFLYEPTEPLRITLKLALCCNTIIQRGHNCLNWVTGLILCYMLLNEHLCYVYITYQYTICRISSVVLD
jgi:hypothetical protein